MKVGFLLECGPDGADYKVLQHVVRTAAPRLHARFVCSGSKRVLFDECNKLVTALFEDERCDRVFVVWDLAPCDAVFKDDSGVPCRAKERAHLMALLRPQDRERTIMLCIHHELEAWLLADGSAIQRALSKPTRPAARVGDDKDPERHVNPKEVLSRIFRNNRKSSGYEDVPWAARIIEQADLAKIERRSPSFARLKQTIEVLDATVQRTGGRP